MTRYLAVTTCNSEQWTQYGRVMVRTFLRHWPKEVDLRLYPEGFPSFCADLESASPWLAEFKARYRPARYNRQEYRRDAVRFAHKIAAIDLASDADCDVLIWMDADIVTHSPVTIEWLDSLFPEPATLAWLDRISSYPECGFLMFRMPTARKIIKQIVQKYRDGSIFQLPETHDSYVIQHVVNRAVVLGEVKTHSLSGKGRTHTRHPWVASRLAETMDHLKGDVRKEAGKSLPTDLPWPRPEPYWQ